MWETKSRRQDHPVRIIISVAAMSRADVAQMIAASGLPHPHRIVRVGT
jgi:hypothetical protein